MEVSNLVSDLGFSSMGQAQLEIVHRDGICSNYLLSVLISGISFK